MGDNIYVVGGINSHGATICTGEVYNYVTQQWREIAPMVERRRSLALCVLNGKVYAVGGNNGAVDLRSVEEYNPSTNKWFSSFMRIKMIIMMFFLFGDYTIAHYHITNSIGDPLKTCVARACIVQPPLSTEKFMPQVIQKASHAHKLTVPL